MSKTIELTDEQWEALERGESIVINPPRKQWEPQGGEFFIHSGEDVVYATSEENCQKFGMEYPTRELAKRAMSYMRQYNRLVAYALEHWPEHEVPDEPQQIWTVSYDVKNKEWSATACYTLRTPWIPYGPKDKVEELVDKLNRGEVVL